MNLLSLVDQQLVKKANNEFRDYTYFHASEWARCHRKIAYEYYEAKGFIKVENSCSKLNAQTCRIFGHGHYSHDRWRSYLQSTGALLGHWRCDNWMAHQDGSDIHGKENKLGIKKPEKCDCGSDRFSYEEIGFTDKETSWGGHVDAILDMKYLAEHHDIPIHGDSKDIDNLSDSERFLLIDFKTINPRGFSALKEVTLDHITQMQIYLYLSGLKFGDFIYEDKGWQRTKHFTVIRDDNFIDKLRNEASYLKYVVSNTRDGKCCLPKRPAEYTSRGHRDCLQCKYRGNCWG